MRYAHILTRLTGAPWFITEDALLRITDLLEARLASGVGLPAADDEPDGDELPSIPGIGVVPINGILGNHLSLMEQICGGCDYASIVAQVRAYANDPSINQVLLHFMSSPGGTASGCPEAFAALREIKAESGKPLLSLVTGMACSAAFYLAGAADGVFATPSSMVGSIGCMRMVEDRSEANAKDGIKRFAITSAAMKDIGNPNRPMTEPEIAVLQQMTDHLGAMFRTDMLSARPSIAPEVFSLGLPYFAADAERLGLIDAIVPNFETFVASVASASLSPIAPPES